MWDLQLWNLSCRMWDLVPWPGIEPRPPALWEHCLSYWTIRDVPTTLSFLALVPELPGRCVSYTLLCFPALVAGVLWLFLLECLCLDLWFVMCSSKNLVFTGQRLYLYFNKTHTGSPGLLDLLRTLLPSALCLYLGLTHSCGWNSDALRFLKIHMLCSKETRVTIDWGLESMLCAFACYFPSLAVLYTPVRQLLQ